LPTEGPLTVTFTLNGYQPESETLEPISNPGSATQMRPNPVMVELTPAPAAPKPPAKKPPAKRPAAKKPAPKPAAAAAPAAPQQQAPSPWPAPPAGQQ
jgi:hypothetical protein